MDRFHKRSSLRTKVKLFSGTQFASALSSIKVKSHARELMKDWAEQKKYVFIILAPLEKDLGSIRKVYD